MYFTGAAADEAALRRLLVAALLGFGQLNTDPRGGVAARVAAGGPRLVLAHAAFEAAELAHLWGRATAAQRRALAQPRTLAAVAVWQGLHVQWLLLGPAAPLAAELAERKPGFFWLGLERLVRELNFRVVCPPDRTQAQVAQDVSLYKAGLVNQPADVLTLAQAQALRG